MHELDLSGWNLPDFVLQNYQNAGLFRMFSWQAECLNLPGVADGRNIVYSAPTSAGKSLVAEILLLRMFLKTKKKCIYILPYISLAREKMFSIRNMFEVIGMRVEGYMGGMSPSGGFMSVDVAVCTIEKANALINRLIDEKRIGTLGMVIVDEIHMVGDSNRGYLIELLLTKIRYMNKLSGSTSDGTTISVVGMSATVPNLQLLATWLDAVYYQTDFRPVPLSYFIKVGSEVFDENLSKVRDCQQVDGLKGDEDDVTSLCLETLATGHSVLIFCPTKNWCEKLTKSIKNQFINLRRNSKQLGFCVNIDSIRDVITQLRRSPAGLDSVLQETVPWAVAYHHAGLTTEERDIVETAFRNNVVRVLVATSTLSSGVNLPARRVIIRTLSFNRGLLDVRSYHQMAGRAGRKGIDDVGESILICKPHEKHKGRKLVSSELPPVKSCLVVDPDSDTEVTTAIRRAILEVIVNGIATTCEQVKSYINCTLLSAQISLNQKQAATRRRSSITSNQSNERVIGKCITWLQEHEFIFMQASDISEIKTLTPTKLGKAALMSSLPTSEALRVLADLQNASKALALDSELHLVYQITPVYSLSSNVNWFNYLNLYEHLSPQHRRVADLVGIDEGFLTRLASTGGLRSNQRLSEARERQLNIHTRFYAALVLHDLLQESPLGVVCDKFDENRGMVQSLQQSAATFAGMVTSFCQQLGWWSLEVLLREFQSRLVFGVQRELLDLIRISLVDSVRARILYNAGLSTCDDVARSSPEAIELILRNGRRFQSKHDSDADDMKSVRGIRVPGTCRSVTEAQAAIIIVDEARTLCGIDDPSATESDSNSVAGGYDSATQVASSNVAMKSNGCALSNQTVLDEITNTTVSPPKKAVRDSFNKASESIETDKENHQATTTHDNLTDLKGVVSRNVRIKKKQADDSLIIASPSKLNKDNTRRVNSEAIASSPLIASDSSITETQMALIFEEDFDLNRGSLVQPCGTPPCKPIASTPVASEQNQLDSFSFPTTTRDRKLSDRNGGFSNNLSGDMFASGDANTKDSSAVNWSNESAFRCTSPAFRQNRNCVVSDVTSNNSPQSVSFLSYLRPNQQDMENSVRSIEAELSKVSLFDSPLPDSTRLIENVPDELRPTITDCGNVRLKICDVSSEESKRREFFDVWKRTSMFSMALFTDINGWKTPASEAETWSGVAVYFGGASVYYISFTASDYNTGKAREQSSDVVKEFIAVLNGFKQDTVAAAFDVKRLVKNFFKFTDFKPQRFSWQFRHFPVLSISTIPIEVTWCRREEAVDLVPSLQSNWFNLLLYAVNYPDSAAMDTRTAAWLMDPDEPYPYDETDLLEKFCPDKIEAVSSLCCEHHGKNCAQAVACFYLMKRMEEVLRERSLWKTFVEVEMRHELCMALLEHNGIAIDVMCLKKLFNELNSRKGKLQGEAYRIVGRTFNLSNISELRKVFYELGLTTSSWGKHWSTNKDALSRLYRESNSHPLIPTILDWRSIGYALSCVQQIDRALFSQDTSVKRYHPSTQLTSTGKINMKMQFIPKTRQLNDEDTGQADKYTFSLREFFIGSEGSVLVAADYSQLELRIMAHCSEDEGLLDVFRQQRDLFCELAALFYNKKDCIEDFTENERRTAKEIVYAINYGIGIKALSSKTCLDETEIEAFRSNFFRTYPHLQIYFKQIIENCRKQGHVTTLSGRRRYLPNVNHRDPELRSKAERQAINTTIAGSAADVIKGATVKIDAEMRERGWDVAKNDEDQPNSCYLVHQLHDELIYEVKSHLVRQAAVIIRDFMTNPLPLSVPLHVKIKTGPSWKNLQDYVLR